MIRFEHTEVLWGLGLLPLMWIIFLIKQYWKKNTLSKMGDLPVVSKLMERASPARVKFKLFLFMLAYISMIFGLANPQIGSKMEQVKRKGIDLMIAMDVSTSMLAEDLYPNRLERTKRAISKLIDQLKGDRIGIVVFGGQAYVQLPITTDYAAAKMFLSSINPGMIPTQGTAIGAAIEKCMHAFDFENKTHKAIIILTDGENHEDDPVDAAKSAAAKDVIVHTIGIGSVQGAPIPLYASGRKTGYKKDREGNTVVTRLDENTLQQIASAGNGMFIRATNANSGIDLILDKLDKMEKTEFGSKIYTDYEDRFQYLIFFALLLLIIEIVLPYHKSKWFSHMHLFSQSE